MLLLTLILWWARTPRRLFDGRIRTAMAIVVIAILAFPCGTVTPSCIADDRYNADPGRSALILTRDAEQNRPGNRPRNQKRLREGTMIPLTVGRIELRGRRWEFISQAARSKPDDVVTTNDPRHSWLVGFIPRARSARPNRTRTKKPATSVDRATALSSFPAAPKEQAPALPMSIVLTENLMLQRIAEAIRVNPTDNQWVISGEITEFFDENRMIIRTAQRSNSN